MELQVITDGDGNFMIKTDSENRYFYAEYPDEVSSMVDMIRSILEKECKYNPNT